MSFLFGFLAGYTLYHFLMNRAVMMRKCCVEHFATHPKCECPDCKRDRE
jgi:hypothetical protein